MTKPGTTIILGGREHGKRISARGASELCFPRIEWRGAYRLASEGIHPEFETVRFQVVYLPLGPVHRVSAALHPDISQDTGERLLADLVVSCWERHGGDTR